MPKHTPARKPHNPRANGQPQTMLVGFAGPLPDPVTFQAYEAAVPGSAERIIAMAEREQINRHKVGRREHRLKAWGLALGSILCAGVIGLGAYAVYMGTPSTVHHMFYAAAALIVAAVGGKLLVNRFAAK